MAKINLTGGEVKSFAPIENGEYLVKILDTELKQTKSGGFALNVTFEIQEGVCKGRRIWESYNIINQSEQASSIGKGQVKTLALCCGLDPESVDDSEMLHGKLVIARVEGKPDMNGIEYPKPKYFKPISNTQKPTPTSNKPLISKELDAFIDSVEATAGRKLVASFSSKVIK